jgi:tRNA (cmo5U34)-methyltransferase
MPDTKPTYEIWKSEPLIRKFLSGIRAAVPLASDQIALLLHLIRSWQPELRTLLDLGCGDGILGRAILDAWPTAHATFLDLSPLMLEQARAECPSAAAVEFVEADFHTSQWRAAIGQDRSFDVVVSGFSIHHQSDQRKRALYAEIYAVLRPGGLFLNLEHVASPTPAVTQLFDAYFVDALYDYHRNSNSGLTRDEVAQEYYDRPDKTANILAPLRDQCDWLTAIGFQDVDCYFKVLEITLFGGRKPPE